MAAPEPPTEDMAARIQAILSEERAKHPEAFEKAIGRAAKLMGTTSNGVVAMLERPVAPPEETIKPDETPTPEQLRAMRPDLAAMPAPEPEATAVAAQAEAQRYAGLPYLTYEDTRFYLQHRPDAFELADLADLLDRAEADPIRALAGINRFLREWMADYEALKAAIRARTSDMEEQMRQFGTVATMLFEVTAARPTEAPVPSSDGRNSTSTSSKDASPSPAASPSTAPPDWQTFIRG